MKFKSLLFIFLGLFISCDEMKSVGNSSGSNSAEKTTNAKLTILIQPFEGLSKTTSRLVAEELKGIYSGDIVLNDPIRFPKNSLNHTKSRYRADSLIKYLGTLAKQDQLIIGITDKDISTTKGEHSDWGVMGLGYCPGKSCIASNFRLKGKNRHEKLFKVAIHELGHTHGLPHCPEKTCLMRDAEGKDRLDEEKGFCSKCKKVLISAGWELK